MACVSAFSIFPRPRLLKEFGQYALEMNPAWIRRVDFREVVYLKRNSLAHWLLQKEFNAALQDADECVGAQYPEDGLRRLSYTNRNIAGVIGANKWVEFLSLYEYLEPYENRHQREWRYVRPEPFGTMDTLEEMIEDVQQDHGWCRAAYTLKLDDTAIVRAYVPERNHEEAKTVLSEFGIEVRSWPRVLYRLGHLAPIEEGVSAS